MLEKLTADDFSPLLNEEFQISLEGNITLLVQLIDVTINRQKEERNWRQSFSLVFRGPRDIELSQGTYPVTHDQLGKLQIFLVPIGPDEKGMCLEAVFN